PLEETQFSSWKAFELYINEYQSRSYQASSCIIFRIRTNTSAAERNAKIKKFKTGSGTPIPDSFGFYAKTLVCTHSGEFKSRGQGKRLRQESRQTGCTAQVMVV
ncbi:hypothetical protein PHYSODRAFT_379767, partial [Phytophthora sojae]